MSILPQVVNTFASIPAMCVASVTVISVTISVLVYATD